MLAHRSQQFPLAHARCDLSDDADGNPILKGKELAQVALVQIRSNAFARYSVAEFGHDAHGGHCPLYAAVEDVTNAELAADLAHVEIATAEAVTGPSRYDKELLEPSKP